MTAFDEDGITIRILWQHEGLESEAPGNHTIIAIAHAAPAPELGASLPPEQRWWHVGELAIFHNPIGARVTFAAPPGAGRVFRLSRSAPRAAR